jgi:hypothetical protein
MMYRKLFNYLLAIMKRVTESSLGKHLEAVRLSRSDLEHIESLIRKVAPSVTYRYADFEFESIEKLASRSPNIIDSLEVKAAEPYLLVKFDRQSVWIYTSSKNLEARGVYAELREFLEDHCLRSVGIRKVILNNFGVLGIFVGTLALIERHLTEAAMAIAIAPITLAVNLFGSSRSQIAMSNQPQGFLSRNRDNLLAGIISSALVSFAIAVIQLAFFDAKV